MTTEITTEQVKEFHPKLGDLGLKLTKDYMNLALQAIELKLIEEKELVELEKKHVDIDNMFEKLLNISADVLTLLKGTVSEITIPQDPAEFEEWEKYSTDYPKVVCHDAFVDVFILASEAINKGSE